MTYKGVDTAFSEWLEMLREAGPFEHSPIREAFEAGFRAGQFDSRRWQEEARVTDPHWYHNAGPATRALFKGDDYVDG